ncbi:MAG: hypothetical protein ACRDN0_30850 [Trebonia sp.]
MDLTGLEVGSPSLEDAYLSLTSDHKTGDHENADHDNLVGALRDV